MAKLKQLFESKTYVRLVAPVSFLTVGEEYFVEKAYKDGYLRLRGDMRLLVRCDIFEDARPVPENPEDA